MATPNPTERPRLPAVTVREVLVHAAGPEHATHTAVEFTAAGNLVCDCGTTAHVTDDVAFAVKVEPSDLARLLSLRIPPRSPMQAQP